LDHGLIPSFAQRRPDWLEVQPAILISDVLKNLIPMRDGNRYDAGMTIVDLAVMRAANQFKRAIFRRFLAHASSLDNLPISLA